LRKLNSESVHELYSSPDKCQGDYMKEWDGWYMQYSWERLKLENLKKNALEDVGMKKESGY
jgi:hypothetical protein